MKISNNKGFSVVEILTVAIIIGVLSAITIPMFFQYKSRSYDADAKANMHNLYLACKNYWGDHGATSDCSVSNVNDATYGYMQSDDVNISSTGSERLYSAVASHSESTNSFTMNWVGIIN